MVDHHLASIPVELRCPNCPHQWHGLPCTHTGWDYSGHHALPCPCPTSTEVAS